MRVLIALSEPFLPQQAGGVQTSSLELQAAFRREGLDVAVASALKRKSVMGARVLAQMRLQRRDFDVGMFRGAPTYRVADIHRHIGQVVDDFRPDAVLVQAMTAMPMAHRISASGVPLAVYWRDAELHRMNGTPVGLNARYLANSRFTAGFYRERFGIESVVVPPLIDRARYLAKEHARRSVVFVGTVPEKGFDVATAVARLCPEIPFTFVESWILPHRRRRAVKATLRRLPNVRFVPHLSSMIGIYAEARILLAPSQWEEGYGRVASEAHMNGVPVIGSRIGGLTEAIGPGGICLDPGAPATEWADCLRALWSSDAAYARLSRAAEEHSWREELDPDWAIRRIIGVLEEAVRAGGGGQDRAKAPRMRTVDPAVVG
jgi:glycosyltransferase involved in cell wall biosynthesis